jgi:hypothetical protein
MAAAGAKRMPEKFTPPTSNMPFYWEIKRRARLAGFIVLGIAGVYAAWHFAPDAAGEGGLRAYAASLGFAGVALFCFGMAALALAGLRREEVEGK